MTALTKWTIVAVCLTVLSMLVPWAHYGDFDIGLSRLPWWWAYPGAAVLMHGSALASVRVGVVVPGVFVVVALAAAMFVSFGYTDASAIFGDVAPPIGPHAGLGPMFAAASLAAQAVGLRARHRAAKPFAA